MNLTGFRLHFFLNCDLIIDYRVLHYVCCRMGTTKDLSNFLDEEMGKGQGPFLVRTFQDADILPRVKRGGYRSMVHLTPEHLADVVIALAVTRQSGQRTARAAKAGVAHFGPLESLWGIKKGIPSLREGLVFFLEQYRDRDITEEDWTFSWVLFLDDDLPTAHVHISKGKGEEFEELRVYYSHIDAHLQPADPSPVCVAAVITGDFLRDLAAMISEDATE